MNQTSLISKIREMDAVELDHYAAELVKKNNQGNTLSGEEQEVLWAIPKFYKQLTGYELIVETNLQLVS